MTPPDRSNRHRALALPIVAVAGASILFAACGSSTKTSTPPVTSVAPPAAGGSATTTGGSSASNAAVTVSATSVPGVGNVLVDGNGRTLYVLASEKGKVTCTSGGGCTTIWPPVVLPSGMLQGIAGSGVQASLLSTAKSPAGDVRLTYGGYPLYRFDQDTGPGMAKGQGVTDSYGLWWVLSPSGNTVTTGASTPTTAPQSGGAGF